MTRPYRLPSRLLSVAVATTVALVLAPAAGAATRFYIRGGGNGHGVGMSQYGADGYALHGKSYEWILAHYYQGTRLASAPAHATVRVLLATGGASFSGANRVATRKLKPALTYSVRPNADGTLTVLDPKGKKVGAFAAPLTASGPGPLSLAGTGMYRGSLEFRPGAGNSVQTVNVVGLEDYVRGVISAEMPSTWAPAALEAQAVAARTYGLTSDAGGTTFDVYADTRSQMYGGVAAETPATDAAVAATAGKIVTYHGAPAITYFFSSSGGHTEDVQYAWPGSAPQPWLRGVRDRYDSAATDPYHRWSYALSMSDAAAKLRQYLHGNLLGIVVTKHGVSPRIVSAEVVGTGGRVTVSGAQLQQAFGLLSTYASFTTVTTDAGAGSGGSGSDSGSGGSGGSAPGAAASAMAALLPLVHDLVSGGAPGIHGSIFPAARGSVVAIQALHGSTWRTIMHARVRTAGAFASRLPVPGTYRVAYRGVDGPSITVA